MARIKFSELAKQTMTPESIARSRKAAIKEIATMELAELRDTLKVTQVDLAERMKVSQAAISKLEKSNSAILVKQEIPTLRKCAGTNHLLRRYGHCISDLPNPTRLRRVGP